jgi:hypothetical protein
MKQEQLAIKNLIASLKVLSKELGFCPYYIEQVLMPKITEIDPRFKIGSIYSLFFNPISAWFNKNYGYPVQINDNKNLAAIYQLLQGDNRNSPNLEQEVSDYLQKTQQQYTGLSREKQFKKVKAVCGAFLQSVKEIKTLIKLEEPLNLVNKPTLHN